MREHSGMDFPTKIGAGAGIAVAAVGLTAAWLLPVAGLAAGAWFAAALVSGAGYAAAWSVAAGLAGGLCGLVLGRAASPLLKTASTKLGMGAGAAVKLAASLFSKRHGQDSVPQARHVTPPHRLPQIPRNGCLKERFDAQAGNAPSAPQPARHRSVAVLRFRA